MCIRPRLGLLALVALLALPLALTSDPAAAARFRTVRKTFANTGAITINTSGSAAPFPSRLLVRGFKDSTLTDVDLVLVGFDHEFPDEVDVLLVPPTKRASRNALVMSDVRASTVVKETTLRLDDEAAWPPGGEALTSGTYRPTNDFDNNGPDNFDTPAPVPTGNTPLKIFDGMDPNGEWRLFIRDDTADSGGACCTAGTCRGAGSWRSRRGSRGSGERPRDAAHGEDRSAVPGCDPNDPAARRYVAEVAVALLGGGGGHDDPISGKREFVSVATGQGHAHYPALGPGIPPAKAATSNPIRNRRPSAVACAQPVL